MQRHATVPVRLERVLDEYGAWCNDCLLGSGVRSWFMVMVGLRMWLRPVLWCCDCGGQNVTDDHAA